MINTIQFHQAIRTLERVLLQLVKGERNDCSDITTHTHTHRHTHTQTHKHTNTHTHTHTHTHILAVAMPSSAAGELGLSLRSARLMRSLHRARLCAPLAAAAV